mmetsp:Transcript_12688/g.19232  ORF Transcript_12688/g.19232 Transcript_12688/m.19232 type:complete len:353 (-) Transcript_12688:191-1249(-)
MPSSYSQEQRADSPHPFSPSSDSGESLTSFLSQNSRLERRADSPYPAARLSRPPTSPRTNSTHGYQLPPRPTRSGQTPRNTGRGADIAMPQSSRRSRSPYSFSSDSLVMPQLELRRSHSPDSFSSVSIARSVPRSISAAMSNPYDESLGNCKDCESPKLLKSLASVTDDCPICMEKLVSVFNEEIGATVPCGHCFHWKCYQECKSSWRSDRCPTCRKPITSFIRLYMTSNLNDNDDSVVDIEEEAFDSLRKSIAQNDALKQEKLALEEELRTIKRASEAEHQLLNTIPKFMKDIGDNIQRFGNGLNYIYKCIQKGCIRAQSDERSVQDRNGIFTGVSDDNDFTDSDDGSDLE